MTMDRRKFLQAIAAGFAAVALPAVALPVAAFAPGSVHEGSAEQIREWAKFDASREYGHTMSVHGLVGEDAAEKTVSILLDDARKFLPPGTKFVVLDGGQEDYGLVQRFAWYYCPVYCPAVIGYDPVSGRTVVCEAVA